MKSKADTTRSTTNIDRIVGQRIKQRREELRFSQDRLATGLGISCQQLQKYERGINRVSASRLIELCRFLSASPDYFFEGIDLGGPAPDGATTAGTSAEKPSESALALVARNPDVVPLIEAFVAIRSPDMRRKLIEMTSILGRDSAA